MQRALLYRAIRRNHRLGCDEPAKEPPLALAGITDVEIVKTGEPVAPGDGQFEVRASVTVTAPAGTAVILTSGGRSAEAASEDGKANRAVKLKFEVRRGA